MPTIPIEGPATLDGGDVPVRSTDDVLGLLPVEVRQTDVAPVRDAIVEALTYIQQEYQRRSEQCAASSDILRAEDQYLDGLTEDHGVYRQPNESDDGPRGRVLNLTASVTPDAIIEAVNAIIAPYTTKQAKYFEPNVDCWFVHDGTGAWGSFVFASGSEATPHYQDRLYPDDSIENGGYSIANRRPPGAWAASDCIGREFVLRIPALGAIESLGSYPINSSDMTIGASSMFVANGTNTGGTEANGQVISFAFDGRQTADDIYSAIVSTVELLKGQSIRWQAIVDSTL